MPTHYVYEEEEKRSADLCQGDVLRRAPGLEALLDVYFPYYSKHPDYIYFIVLTQTCDLVRRDGGPCGASYISLAAVRPIKDALLIEAAKYQPAPLQGTNIVGSKGRDRLGMFLESLMDNNKAGLFYLHTDVDVGITEPCCAFLQLSVSLRAVHYQQCLDAKIAQLKEPFQAKLGWLIGSMSSRVATTEWNIERPAEKVSKVASKLIGQNIDSHDDEKIKKALTAIEADGKLKGMKPEQIADAIKKTKVDPKLKQFKDRAQATMADIKLIEPVRAMAVKSIRDDDDLKLAIALLLTGGAAPEAVAEQVIHLVTEKLVGSLDDTPGPERDSFVADLIADLMADAVLKSFIK